MKKIDVGNLDSFQSPESRGWFLGQFIDPSSPFHSDAFEVKWSTHPLGDTKPRPEGGPTKTITFLVDGEFKVTFPESNETYTLSKPGDYVYFGEDILHTWESLKEGTRMLTIRWPSIPPPAKA